ncbi:MAG TPA: energy transducer TonB [Alphaproteobacteria bacterium]|nr:energy transducer TonB [Alphaproteobacteria bacterium]
MNRPLSLAFVISALLHAAALAFVMVHGSQQQAQTFELAVDIAWVPPSGSIPAPGVAPGEMPGKAAAISVGAALGASPAGSTRGSMVQEAPGFEHEESRGAARGIAGSSPGDDAERNRRFFSRSPATARETNETAGSRGRRGIVAERRTESRGAESLWERSASAAVIGDAAAASAPEQSSSHEFGANWTNAAENSASASSNLMADSAEIVYRVAPTYPVAARRKGIEGAVLLRVRFDAGGRPEDISVMTSSGSKMLDDAAREAVARWRFRGGVAGALELPITFRLVAASAADASPVNQGVVR